MIEEARQGILPAEKTWKLGDYLDSWIEKEKRRPLTRKRHESIVRLHIKPRLGHLRLDALSVRIAQNFLDDLFTDGRSVATVHQTRKVLSAALTYAMRQELITRNVARLVELPRYRAAEADHWTPEETTRFLNAARTDPLYPVFVLLALYGLRRGEAVGLRWRDVDFDRGVVRIRQQVQRIDGELRQVELKTETSERDEPLLATAREVLLRQREAQVAARAEAGDSWHSTGDDYELVFTTRTGRPLESHNVARSFLRICAQHGLRRITIHGLRHSNATAQKELQVHARDTQAILGHGDIRTTGIYEHVGLESKRNALQKVEGRLFAEASNRERCRQNCRQTANEAAASESKSLPKKASTPDGLDAFFGGSSQTRTGDTRLFRAFGATVEQRLTSINNVVRAHTRTWKLGCVAVNLAVNNPPA
ncbi:site-specific integrase [Amycolatopsis sp. OK19-0408]|uniref:Site-specific integrase n=1 Tax=Amycolatopsis iheyensis TaxID=2945988 RepID=A0A9X2SJ34_9PSEU|nr:site-specific integrase [Amycolatopsis iheyensis]MCR6484044.1 site-specific integrase [Amycolatopsis iheyensis]